jgi:hypothetical protein
MKVFFLEPALAHDRKRNVPSRLLPLLHPAPHVKLSGEVLALQDSFLLRIVVEMLQKSFGLFFFAKANTLGKNGHSQCRSVRLSKEHGARRLKEAKLFPPNLGGFSLVKARSKCFFLP